MRLKKLELIGFKSFADKTEIFFDKGITCIVGPNGCGKSNVSDSIRWVLGERSAKILRGSSMEDVIFNGTEVRKPLAFAEVSLTIDNSDRGIPIEYNEVTIARRLYRTGESEYLLNKTVCRLKDVQDLILDTGIGSSSYSMIEQGRIDYILKADPEERRFLIEEAAGIAKYKAKKDESIRKLERTEDNLKRLSDIVFEVQKNIQYAERQAKRAEKYKVELERLKSLEIKRAFFQRDQIAAQKNTIETHLAAQKEQLVQIEQQLGKARTDLESQEAILKAILVRYQEKESERYGLLSRIETNDQKVKFLQDKKVELAQQRGQVLQEQDQLRESINSGVLKKKELEDLLKIQDSELTQCKSRLDELRERLCNHETVISTSKKETDRIRHNFFEAAQATTQTRNEYHHYKILKENLDQQKKREEAETTRVSSEIAQWDQKLREIHEAIGLKTSDFSSSEQQETAAVAQFEQLVSERQIEEDRIHGIRLSIKEKEARLRVLTEVDEHQESSFLSFVSENTSDASGLARDLKSILKITEGKEWALDIALGHFVRSVIIKNPSSVRELAEKIKSRRAFTAGLLVRNCFSSSPLTIYEDRRLRDAGFEPLTASISVTENWQSTIDSLLGNVYLIQEFPIHSIDSLLQDRSGAFLISRDGFLLTPDKRIFFWNNTNRTEFVFSRSGEVARIRQELESLASQLSSGEESLKSFLQKQQELDQEVVNIRSQKTALIIEKETLETEKRNIEDRLAGFRKEMDVTQSELQDMIREAQQVFGRELQLESELHQKETDEAKLHELQRQKETELQSLAAERENLLLELQQAKSQVDQYQQGIQHLHDSMRLMDEHIAKDNDRLVFLEEGLHRFAAKETDLAQDEKQCGELAKEYQGELNKVDVELELQKNERVAQETKLATQRHSIESLLEDQKKIQDEEHHITMQTMDLDYQIKNVGERLLQRYRMDLSQIDPTAYPFTVEELQNVDEEISQLQTKVDSLGTVNLLAIEEYQELKQRYDFLTSQQQDLEEARNSLMEAIRKINRTTKQLFEDTFTQVQVTFREYYQTLFRGGDAKLTLIDEEHPLESGIDIVVRPPGKKLQNMSLLSGGEKALTAVALLFALFKIRPSPFCLLDEVDAPLDEANIDRFLTVLRSFIATTQFLIITHNRKTIAMGDSLYGVTMEEPGVSKIVSVKVRAGDESLPGEDLHPTVAAEQAGQGPAHTSTT